MRKNRPRLLALISLTAVLPLLAACEYFLGSGFTPNVSIDLGQFSPAGRALAPPAGISFTRIEVSVYGPGMAAIAKSVSPGARYLNMYVPAGPGRRFKVEAFFNVIDPQVFPYDHLRSFIGRASADVEAGRLVRIALAMAAGSTIYLVPDYGGGVIHYSDDLSSFDPDRITVLGAGQGIDPADIEISARGVIYSANYGARVNVINYADNIAGAGSGAIPASDRVLALAMDRNAGFNIDRDKVSDTSVLYFSTGVNQLYFTVVDFAPTPPQLMNLEGRVTAVYGLAVDQWTHRLYISGVCDGSPAIVVYDPFHAVMNPGGGYVFGRILSVKTDPRFINLFDVEVTDTAVYALNVNATTDAVPSVMQFDRDLNFIRGYGSVSRDSGGFVASTAPGDFYYPLRFLAQENDGLTILDDSNLADSTEEDYDKLVRIGRDLDPSSWTTYPEVQKPGGPAGEYFRFFF